MESQFKTGVLPAFRARQWSRLRLPQLPQLGRVGPVTLDFGPEVQYRRATAKGRQHIYEEIDGFTDDVLPDVGRYGMSPRNLRDMSHSSLPPGCQ